MSPTRRLAAIMAADVAGFSAAMERDEEGTFAQVQELRRKIIEPKIGEYQGRLIKTTGDGFLAEFASPIAATRCALAIQTELANAPLQLRIGLNLGDVIVEDSGDVYGEGVNVAARLETLADPGGVLISGKVHSEIEGKVDASFVDRGEQQVKNIARPVRIYALSTSGGKSASDVASVAVRDDNPLPLPDKPSIAVLPFQNMSGDPEQEYFADGMVEEIITALSRFKSLFVIARNSSFTYKGKAVDIKRVGRELGVRYVLEGSVRKSGTRVRITAQLIEAATGAHMWADKVDGALTEVFELQDAVATTVVGAIAPRLRQAELEQIKRKPPESWDSYDHFLRGRAMNAEHHPESCTEALSEFRKAIAADPIFGRAHMAAARVLETMHSGYYQPITEADRNEAMRLTEEALRLAGDDAEVLADAAWVIALVKSDLDRAALLVDRAIALNPNLSGAWANRGWTNIWLGEPLRALDDFEHAIRLNPADPRAMSSVGFGSAMACYFLRRDEEHVTWLKKTLALMPDHPSALAMLAYALDLAGRREEAREIVTRLCARYPWWRLSAIRQVTRNRHRRPEYQTMLERAGEHLVPLGLPE